MYFFKIIIRGSRRHNGSDSYDDDDDFVDGFIII